MEFSKELVLKYFINLTGSKAVGMFETDITYVVRFKSNINRGYCGYYYGDYCKSEFGPKIGQFITQQRKNKWNLVKTY